MKFKTQYRKHGNRLYKIAGDECMEVQYEPEECVYCIGYISGSQLLPNRNSVTISATEFETAKEHVLKQIANFGVFKNEKSN